MERDFEAEMHSPHAGGLIIPQATSGHSTIHSLDFNGELIIALGPLPSGHSCS